MLTLEQYNALLGAIPDISVELQSKGHEVPNVSTNTPSTSAPRQPEKSPSKDQKRKKKKKMNIEATSDEEESD
jgi:hypothetical protein